ncbi:tripartite tricarboxylate transporter TctA [Pseudomonas aeruginosa]|nr:tripartite tricarboxylate transporter TctA [Pseudomonas aeruginosa]
MALLIPVAFALGLPPETALILLAAVYLGCEYGGRISSILPQHPRRSLDRDDHPRRLPDGTQGPGRRGPVAVGLEFVHWRFHRHLRMVLFAPLLAKWAIAFGPAEYFVLMVFAIVCLGGWPATAR